MGLGSREVISHQIAGTVAQSVERWTPSGESTRPG